MDKKTISTQRIFRLNDFFKFDTDLHNLSLTEIAIWCCAYRNTYWPNGTFKLSYSRCAAQCNCSEITARRTLKTLCEKPLIQRLKQGKGTASSIYALLSSEGDLLPQTVEYLRTKNFSQKHSDDDDDYSDE